MKSKLFSRILESFRSKDDKESFEKADSAVLLRKQLIEGIVDVLKPFRESGHTLNSLKLYVNGSAQDQALDLVISASDFEENLFLNLENSGLKEALNARFDYEAVSPPENLKTLTISEGVFLHLDYQKRVVSSKITIQALKGKLDKKSYQFEIEPGDRINIGRGESPQLSSGKIHRNDVIISDIDDKNSPDYAINRFVSRAHAYIQYSNGFVLSVYEGGCYKTGNRTRIFNENNEVTDAQNMAVAYPLNGGDQIELGKSMILKITI